MHRTQVLTAIDGIIMKQTKTAEKHIYIECLALKGRPRKPIDVCRQCRRHRKCSSYQRYLQPALPFRFED